MTNLKEQPDAPTWRPAPREYHRNRRLTFAPAAWLKLEWMLHAGDTEIGGFGVSSTDDPLYIESFATVRQRTTAVTVEFDDDAVADYYDACVDAGLSPARFARIWVHTHPGDSPRPSGTDEQTFARAFGGCDWAVMFIAARTGRTYARLSFAAGPGGDVLLPVGVDWAAWPQVLSEADGPCSWLPRWKAEFEQNVIARPLTSDWSNARAAQDPAWDVDLLLGGSWPWGDDPAGLDGLHERQAGEADLVCRFERLGTLDEGEGVSNDDA